MPCAKTSAFFPNLFILLSTELRLEDTLAGERTWDWLWLYGLMKWLLLTSELRMSQQWLEFPLRDLEVWLPSSMGSCCAFLSRSTAQKLQNCQGRRKIVACWSWLSSGLYKEVIKWLVTTDFWLHDSLLIINIIKADSCRHFLSRITCDPLVLSERGLWQNLDFHRDIVKTVDLCFTFVFIFPVDDTGSLLLIE